MDPAFPREDCSFVMVHARFPAQDFVLAGGVKFAAPKKRGSGDPPFTSPKGAGYEKRSGSP